MLFKSRKIRRGFIFTTIFFFLFSAICISIVLDSEWDEIPDGWIALYFAVLCSIAEIGLLTIAIYYYSTRDMTYSHKFSIDNIFITWISIIFFIIGISLICIEPVENSLLVGYYTIIVISIAWIAGIGEWLYKRKRKKKRGSKTLIKTKYLFAKC
ncbi:MAG: hypothetical protein ACFFA3_18505 [Promethearchaeota archaeon]